MARSRACRSSGERVPGIDRAQQPESFLQAHELVGAQAAVVDVIRHQRRVDHADRGSGEDQPQPALPVVRDPVRLVPAPGFEQPGAAHGRPAAGEAGVEDGGALPAGREGIAAGVGPDAGAILIEPGIGGNDVEIRPRGGRRRDRRRSLGIVEVVGVEDRNEVSRRGSERMVERRSASAVRLAEQDDLVAECLEGLLRPIGRSVVTDDHLVRGSRLAERGADCPDTVGAAL